MNRVTLKDNLTYSNHPSTDKNGKAILGRLKGPCADFLSPTRNGRLYSEELWEKVFKDDIITEYFNNGGIFGELGHPDREEVDLEKVAICMPNPPEKDENGHLIGIFDILDTPCGRVLKTLCDYGYKLGISSRGSGDVEMDVDGNESVTPDTYKLSAFDIVTLPAVKEARLDLVNESLNRTRKPLTEALQETISSSTENEQKIMVEALNDLSIDYLPEASAKAVDIDKVPNEDANTVSNAVDDGNSKLVEELQNALEAKLDLEGQVTTLQEKLSVCYAKEKTITEELGHVKTSLSDITKRAKKVKPLETRISVLNEQLDNTARSLKEAQNDLASTREEMSGKLNSLEENLSSTRSKLSRVLKESASYKKSAEQEIAQLRGEVAELKNESLAKHKEYQKKLSSANTLLEKYKRITKDTVNRYIDSKASIIGVSGNDIRNRLDEKYSLNDIDRVCEDLRDYKVNISSLPFNINKNTRVQINESKSDVIRRNSDSGNYDDDIDDTLINFLK